MEELKAWDEPDDRGEGAGRLVETEDDPVRRAVARIRLRAQVAALEDMLGWDRDVALERLHDSYDRNRIVMTVMARRQEADRISDATASRLRAVVGDGGSAELQVRRLLDLYAAEGLYWVARSAEGDIAGGYLPASREGGAKAWTATLTASGWSTAAPDPEVFGEILRRAHLAGLLVDPRRGGPNLAVFPSDGDAAPGPWRLEMAVPG